MPLQELLGYEISKIVLPAQKKKRKKTLPISDDAVQVINHEITGSNYKILFVEMALNLDIDLKKDKVIIQVTGNLDCFENHTQEYKDFVKKFPWARTVAFNMRGVSHSRGRVCSDAIWINDTISVIEYYRKKGFPSQNILLRGHSLGGAIVTLAAAELYKRDKAKVKPEEAPLIRSVRVINDRSFASIPAHIVHTLLGPNYASLILSFLFSPLLYRASQRKSFLKPFVQLFVFFRISTLLNKEYPQILFKPIISFLVWASFGTMDAAKAYKSLPADSKDYFVAKDDFVIAKAASLHHALKDERTQKKNKIKKAEQEQGETNQSSHILKLKSELLNLKDCKLEPSEAGIRSGGNPHSLPLCEMQTAYKKKNNGHFRPSISGLESLENKIARLLLK